MRNCNKCVYSTRDGNCRKWECKGTVTVEDIKQKAIKEFAEWLECSGFNYDEAEAFWCRTHFDGKMFAEEVYTTNELLNLYEKERK